MVGVEGDLGDRIIGPGDGYYGPSWGYGPNYGPWGYGFAPGRWGYGPCWRGGYWNLCHIRPMALILVSGYADTLIR